YYSPLMISDCAYAEELYDLVPLQVLQWINILTSAGAIVLVCYPASHYLHRTIFEKVTKGLIISLYVFIVIFSVCLILVQGSQLAYRYTARVKCDAQSPKVWCIFRYLVTVLTSSFALVHVGITVQHGLYSFLFSQRIQQLAARFSIIISAIIPVIFGVLAYHRDSLDGRIAYCSGFTEHGGEIVMSLLYFLLALDFFNTLVSFLLWKFNERSLITDRQSFDLARTFHRRQNLYAMQQFLPIATLHAIFYSVLFCILTFKITK
ncbi:hypothetical protein PENTCL1PPCAC_15421, partial [Pristionchus entomophagus]